jgi:hypothetical protein
MSHQREVQRETIRALEVNRLERLMKTYFPAAQKGDGVTAFEDGCRTLKVAGLYPVNNEQTQHPAVINGGDIQIVAAQSPGNDYERWKPAGTAGATRTGPSPQYHPFQAHFLRPGKR